MLRSTSYGVPDVQACLVPELPDVEGYRRLLQSCLRGRAISAVDVHDARVLRNCTQEELVHWLVNSEVEAVERRGKWLQVKILGTGTLLVHLGMTGLIVSSPTTTAMQSSDRLSLTAERTVVFRDRRRLGGVWFVVIGQATTDVTGRLGPDARGISLSALSMALGGTRRAVKSVLLDQSVIAGLGNMLSDEVLWAAGIHPARPAMSISGGEVRALHSAMAKILGRAVRAGHIPRSRGWLASQRAAPEPMCPRCRTPLQRHRVGDRRAQMCPVCQT